MKVNSYIYSGDVLYQVTLTGNQKPKLSQKGEVIKNINDNNKKFCIPSPILILSHIVKIF